MVNIIDDEIWNLEPALKPEEEAMLRKLHDMLQSTADELKLLSGELALRHEPGTRAKAPPTPLDEEFNEKVHIEEVVNAKFHGYKIVDKPLPFSPESKPNKLINESLGSKLQKTKTVNAGVQVNPVSSLKKTTNSNLQLSQTKVVQIKDYETNLKEKVLNNGKIRKDTPMVHYNEISYKYDEPNTDTPSKKPLQVQKMPGINIRSELKEQKVLQLDIMPETKNDTAASASNTNVGVIAVQYEPTVGPPRASSKLSTQAPKIIIESSKQPIRRITKMSTCDSSESTNNVSSDAQHRLDMQKQLKLVLRNSPKSSARVDSKYKKVQDKNKMEPPKRPHSSLDEWKKKLNAVYGQPSCSKKGITAKTKKASPKKCNLIPRPKPKSNLLNNAEYIPYTQLTLGGVRVSDIEKEISDFPNKKDIPLSPILDKIISSRENSFHKDSPRKYKDSPKVLTTSDENLLQEVIDIEKTVSKTLAKTVKKTTKKVQEVFKHESENSNNDDGNSYADDFEDEKSDQSASSNHINSKKSPAGSNRSSHSVGNSSDDAKESDQEKSNLDTSEPNVQNTTYTKVLNLSFKNSVDVFEFVHSIDTQETGTQSNSTSKISLKETQTSPRNERSNIQPIRNDLWPSIDPKGEVENMFQLEKEFIKKLILDEYGEILEKNITKPSTSNERDEEDRKNNVVASQKNTQTSPAHVKNVMTSPTRTKTRTTSPFSLSVTVDRQTSPMIQVTQEEQHRIEIENEAEDLGISINLSSPRFSLRLPQNSREVLSNLDDCSQSKIDQKEISQVSKTFRKYAASSTSSVDADNSSDISSLGEVRMKFKRRLRKSKISSVSESSSSSVLSRYSSGLVSAEILPLKSEGEVSLGQVVKKPSRRKRKESDGEMA